MKLTSSDVKRMLAKSSIDTGPAGSLTTKPSSSRSTYSSNSPSLEELSFPGSKYRILTLLPYTECTWSAEQGDKNQYLSIQLYVTRCGHRTILEKLAFAACGGGDSSTL